MIHEYGAVLSAGDDNGIDPPVENLFSEIDQSGLRHIQRKAEVAGDLVCVGFDQERFGLDGLCKERPGRIHKDSSLAFFQLPYIKTINIVSHTGRNTAGEHENGGGTRVKFQRFRQRLDIP